VGWSDEVEGAGHRLSRSERTRERSPEIPVGIQRRDSSAGAEMWSAHVEAGRGALHRDADAADPVQASCTRAGADRRDALEDLLHQNSVSGGAPGALIDRRNPGRRTPCADDVGDRHPRAAQVDELTESGFDGGRHLVGERREEPLLRGFHGVRRRTTASRNGVCTSA